MGTVLDKPEMFPAQSGRRAGVHAADGPKGGFFQAKGVGLA